MNIELDGQREEASDSAEPIKPAQRQLLRGWETKVAYLQHVFARAVAWTATRAWQVTADWRAVRPIISRASAHLAILTLAVMAILFSGLNLPAREPMASATQAQETAVSTPEIVAQRALGNAASIALDQPPSSSDALGIGSMQALANNQWGDDNTTVVRYAQPRTEIPTRPRLEVITHTVQPGEIVQSIAGTYGLQPTTILWSNPTLEEMPDLLRIGQQLIILPVDGVYHTVVEDDTVESIAEKYKVEVDAITDHPLNNLLPPLFRVQEGTKLIVPGGTKPYVPRRVTSYTGPVPNNVRATGAFIWPVLGTVTQSYWWGHRAIDIGAPTGSAVLASDGGYVSFVGWTDVGYGYLIIIDHANGYSTYYAHLSQMYVMLGQQVQRGQVIGAAGSTGRSTGPHVHLEIRYRGVEQNPLVYLP